MTMRIGCAVCNTTLDPFDLKPHKCLKENMKPHKHAELIKAWADGAEIQCDGIQGWEDCPSPRWENCITYRIKPEPKPNVVLCNYARIHRGKLIQELDAKYPNLKLVFDGETGELKSAEVLK